MTKTQLIRGLIAERDKLKAINAELLAALKAVIDEVGPTQEDIDQYIADGRLDCVQSFIAARAAIAKTEGRT